MRTRTWTVLATALLVPTLASAASPAGWFLAGKDPASYVMEQDSKTAHEGKTSARFASTREPKGFGTMMQSFEPGEYRGKRVRLSAFVKAKQIRDWAGMWMRVDGPDMRSLGFDNMQGRPIRGTSDWKRYDIVLDVDDTAKGIAFGILMEGPGTLWLDEVKFQIVDESVPTTGGASKRKPENLDFER